LEGHENVPNDYARLRIGHVCEQEWSNDIARGVNVPLRCLQIVGNGHAPLADINPSGFQIQALQIWASPSGDEERVCEESSFGQLARLSIHELKGDFTCLTGCYRPRIDIFNDTHTLVNQAELKKFRGISIFSWQKLIAALDNRYLRAKTAKCLREFATDRPAAEHNHVFSFFL
jgi:hypothetical protein